jgi:hypothetical protein
MELYLLNKIFENLDKSYTLDEAKKKAFLFLECVPDVEKLGGDYWIQIAKEWDLNIWWEDCTSIEMTLYPCEKMKDGYFYDTDKEGIKITGKDFPVDEQKLKDFLEYFENVEYHNTGVHYISGGFTVAEYDDSDEEEIFITLKWGVQNDVENRVNTESYRISIEDFNNATSNEELYKLLDD